MTPISFASLSREKRENIHNRTAAVSSFSGTGKKRKSLWREKDWAPILTIV